VITPSRVTANQIAARGVQAQVIRNGAELRPPSPRPAGAPERYLLYFGALQPWQGVDTALRALARLDEELVICASVHQRKAKPYRKLAEKLGVEQRVHWHFALPEDELAGWREHALLSLAPLRDCSRNAVQGCAPLKILESMAAGVPVVASDLPAVRELLADGVHGKLVAPDRPGELARAIRVLLDFPERRAAMGRAARRDVNTWDDSLARLRELYTTPMEAVA
jgi:glycosyltransferase involved in cell wall biosynthesis